MKIAVIGAGIIGVTTAYELARDGHKVTVLERCAAVAEMSSFANAGLVASGYVAPWAAPGMPTKLIQQLFNHSAPFKVGLGLSGRELAWMWKWLRACKRETYLTNLAHLQRLALYSRQHLHHITADLKLDYERSDGCMVMLRSEKDSNVMQPGLQVLRDAGVSVHQLNPVEARKIEPALNAETAFFGALHLPADEAGNCRQFALLLKNEAQRIGVKFSFNTSVTRFVPSNGVALEVAGEKMPRNYDAIVVCAGLNSARLLEPVGLKIPMAAVYGYSLTATMREPLNAPRSAVLDERFKVSISRLGNRVRVAGTAELGGAPDKKNADAIQTLYKVLHDWFPGAANLSNGVQHWKGARPMTPGGMPILGPSGVSGLWLNLGHGANGWALSCGSARALADLIGRKKPEVDVSGFAVGQLGA